MEPEIEEKMLQDEARKIEKRHKMLMMAAIGAGVLLMIVLIVFFIMLAGSRSKLAEAEQAREQLQLENQMLQSQSEFAQIDSEFALMESQTQLLANDSLAEKYAATRAQVEKLMNELQNEKNKSAAQIKKLQDEIATLKGILRDYTQRINELMAENEGLKTENEQVKSRNQQLNRQVQQVQKSNEQLTERMTLAEKLNVTGVNLTALNKKDKKEKNITKAVRMRVTFTISPNNSTPPGEKIIWLRLISPEGDLLGNGGSFEFEGTSLQSTARTSVEYANEEIGGVTIYWDVNSTLNPGEYKVELFSDNFRLASRTFTMTK